MKTFETKYTYKDISIVPSDVTDISTRSNCNPFLRGSSMLPLMTAPMSSVISIENFNLFRENGIIPVLPRTLDFNGVEDILKSAEIDFVSLSLSEFESVILSDLINAEKQYRLCIDIANGHMVQLHDLIKHAKNKYPNIIIMSGNVASPGGYVALSEAGCDYVRVGIGGGFGCITSSNSGVHYPLASLVRETWEASLTLKNPAYIVADGGIRGFSDITKALALGADFVMCGSIFNKMLESAGETKMFKNSVSLSNIIEFNDENSHKVNQYSDFIKETFKTGTTYHKIFYGMSTKRAQVEMGHIKLKTSEGVEKIQQVEYTMSQWVDNFIHYLKSVMSYTNKTNVEDFIGLPDKHFILMSPNSIVAINK